MLGKVFLDLTSKAQSIKGKTDTLYFTKIKNFFSAKDLLGGWKDKLQTRRTLFVNHVSDEELISRICKEFSNLNSKKKKNPSRTQAKDKKGHLANDMQKENSTWKDIQYH